MAVPKRKLRIAVADDEPDTRQFFEEVLPHLGYQVVAVAETGRQLIEQSQTTRPDLIITDIKMPDMDGIEATTAINRDRPTPAILVSAHCDSDLLARAGEDHIMAYLVKPVKPVDLQAAIALAIMRFEHFQRIRQEAADLRQALEDRKLIERAKGVLMRRQRLDEPTAFRRLQRLASDRNHKLVEAARLILSADDTFQALEQD